MKRPLAVIGSVFMVAAAAAVFLGKASYPLLLAVLILGGGLSLKSKRLRRTVYIPVILFAAAAAIVSVSIYSSVKVTPAESFRGQTALIKAELCELPYEQYGRIYYKLDAKSIVTEDGESVKNVKILVSSRDDLKIEPYDRIEAYVSFSKNTSLSRVTKGIMLNGSLDTEKPVVVTKTSDKPPFYYALMARKGISQKISELLPEKESSFVTAFLTGDGTSVSEELRSDLRKSGLSHIIVVSGFHLSVLSRLVFLLFMLLFGKNKRTASGMCIVFVLGYMAMTGFSVSILRAGIMQIITLFGTMAFRKADSLNSLGVAVLLITLCNPYAAADTSLILSACATFGILVISPNIEKRLKELIKSEKSSSHSRLRRFYESIVYSFITIFSVSLSAYLMTLPAIILRFREIPAYSVITNVLIAPVIPFMMIAVIFMLLLSFLPWLSSPLAFVSKILADYIIEVSGNVSSIPFSVINVSQDFVPFWLAAVMMLGLLLLLMRKRKYRVRIFAITAIITFVTGSVLTEFADRNIVQLAVLDSGDGLSVVVTENHNSLVLCCGGEYGVSDPVSEQLDSTLTDSVSLLLLTDSNHRTSLYASHVLKNYPVKTAEVYDLDQYSDEVRSLINDACCRVDHSIKDGKINEVHIGDKTVKSLVTWKSRCIYLDIHGFVILICTDKTDCEKLPEDWLEADLLIVNGMPKNSYLLKYKALIVSDAAENKNKYQKLSDAKSLYNTYSEGNIILRLDNNNLFETRRENHWLN